MTLGWGKTSVPSGNSLISVSDPVEGLFEVMRRSSRALEALGLSPRALLLPELQTNKVTFRCDVLSAEVERTA